MKPDGYAAAAATLVRTPTETPEACACSPWTALFPRRMPPSSMISEPTTVAPNPLPVARISRRPEVLTLPWIEPPTTTLRPLTLPLTRPCSPTDRSPSVVRSPFISPSKRMFEVDCSRPSSLIWLLNTVSATMGAASRGDLLSNTHTSWQVVIALCQNGYAFGFLASLKKVTPGANPEGRSTPRSGARTSDRL